MNVTFQKAPVHFNITSPELLSKWLQILDTFIAFTNSWGLLLTFDVLHTYYEQNQLRDYSRSSISWISTTCAFIVLSAGVVVGPLYDHGYYKALMVSGSLLQVFGLMMLSISSQYYQFFLCQATCLGLGAGMVFIPSVAASIACLPDPGTRAKAMGLMGCGSSLGGIVFPIMLRTLLRSVGFPWAIRSVAFVVLALYMISYLALFNKSQQPPTVRRFFDKSALTDAPFITMCIASLFSAIAYYIPLLYLPLLTRAKVPSVDADLIFDLIAITNGASAVGRLISGLIASRIGPIETVALSLLSVSIILFCWIVVDSVAGTIVWLVFWGMVSGVLVALPGAYIPLLCSSLSIIGTRSGFYWVWIGLGMLIGSPIDGAVYEGRASQGRSWHIELFAGLSMVLAAALTIYPIMYLRRQPKAWVR